MMQAKHLAAVTAIVALAACNAEGEQASTPSPLTLTETAAGHYCQMEILQHEGPKAQMFLAGFAQPLWFSQVRDGLARVKSPERSSEILVLYVNDMGQAASWAEPGVDNWIVADDAFFVVGSKAVGGMGAPEIVPFAEGARADEFQRNHGGNIMRYADISTEMVLAPLIGGSSSQEAVR